MGAGKGQSIFSETIRDLLCEHNSKHLYVCAEMTKEKRLKL